MKNKRYLSFIIIYSVILAGLFILITLYNPFFFKHLWESIKVLFYSFIYYFKNMFEDDVVAPGTYYDLAILDVDNIKLPISKDFNVLINWFKASFFMYFSKDYFLDFNKGFIFAISHLQLIILLIFGVIALGYFINLIYFSEYFDKKGGYTKNWLKFNKFYKAKIIPVKNYLNDFRDFVLSKFIFVKILMFYFLLVFGIISWIIDVFSIFLCFSTSINIIYLWKMIYVSFYDLFGVISFFPLIVWIIIIYLIIVHVRYKNGINRLCRFDYMNREFVSGLGTCTFIKGPPGCGKTTLLTDFVLCSEQNNRYEFLNIIDKYKRLFKNFNFYKYFKTINLLKKQGILTNPFKLEAWIDKRRNTYMMYQVGYLKANDKAMNELCFAYDFKIYEEKIFDGLKNISVFEMMKIVGVAYFYYTTKTNLEYGNYPIRNDSYYVESEAILGSWEFNYFTNKKREFDELTSYSHIIDNNMLRLGKRMYSNNETMWLGCFTLYLDEADKERGNQFDSREMKRLDDNANLVNDYYNLALKLSRHWSTIDFIPFCKFFTTSQRVGSVNSDLVEINENIITIENNHRKKLAIRCWFYERMIFEFINNLGDKYNRNYESTRNYYSLIYRFMNFIFSAVYKHYLRMINLFSYTKLKLKVEDGNEVIKDEGCTYYLMDKKIYSSRFATDVFKCLFSTTGLENSSYIEESTSFNDLYTSPGELNYQNSFMWKKLKNLENSGGAEYEEK